MKAHPFFRGLDWNDLLNREDPQLEDEEETRKFHHRHTDKPRLMSGRRAEHFKL